MIWQCFKDDQTSLLHDDDASVKTVWKLWTIYTETSQFCNTEVWTLIKHCHLMLYQFLKCHWNKSITIYCNICDKIMFVSFHQTDLWYVYKLHITWILKKNSIVCLSSFKFQTFYFRSCLDPNPFRLVGWISLLTADKGSSKGHKTVCRRSRNRQHMQIISIGDPLVFTRKTVHSLMLIYTHVHYTCQGHFFTA